MKKTPTFPTLHKVEVALAKWKRINRIDDVSVSVNGLVKMVSEDMRVFDGKDRSYEEALRILMILIKDDNLAFFARVREYLAH